MVGGAGVEIGEDGGAEAAFADEHFAALAEGDVGDGGVVLQGGGEDGGGYFRAGTIGAGGDEVAGAIEADGPDLVLAGVPDGVIKAVGVDLEAKHASAGGGEIIGGAAIGDGGAGTLDFRAGVVEAANPAVIEIGHEELLVALVEADVAQGDGADAGEGAEGGDVEGGAIDFVNGSPAAGAGVFIGVNRGGGDVDIRGRLVVEGDAEDFAKVAGAPLVDGGTGGVVEHGGHPVDAKAGGVHGGVAGVHDA